MQQFLLIYWKNGEHGTEYDIVVPIEFPYIRHSWTVD